MTGNRTLTPSGHPAVPVIWARTSVLIAILVIFTSLCGIFLPSTYAREVPLWAVQAVGQDIANLFVATLLLCCIYFLTRRSLRAYLVWLGLLMYLIYAFAIYAFALHFQSLFLCYVAVLGLSAFTLAGGLMAADFESVARILRTNPALRYAAIILGIIAVLFTYLWLSAIIPNLLAGTVPEKIVALNLPVSPIHVLDLAFLLPGMLATAYLLRQDSPTGYLMAVPMLIFSITMGSGILAMNLLSLLTGMPYSVSSSILVSLIVVICTVLVYVCLKGIGGIADPES